MPSVNLRYVQNLKLCTLSFGKLSNYYDHLLRFFSGFQYFLIYMAKYFDRFLSFLTLITIQRDYAENTMSTKMPPKL